MSINYCPNSLKYTKQLKEGEEKTMISGLIYTNY